MSCIPLVIYKSPPFHHNVHPYGYCKSVMSTTKTQPSRQRKQDTRSGSPSPPYIDIGSWPKHTPPLCHARRHNMLYGIDEIRWNIKTLTQHEKRKRRPLPTAYYEHANTGPRAVESPPADQMPHSSEASNEQQRLVPHEQAHPSPGKNLDNAIAATTNNPPAVLAPDNGTNTLTTHDAMARDILDTRPLLERPEAETGIVARGDEFAAVGRKGESGDGGGVGEHVVGALAWISHQYRYMSGGR